MRMMHRRVCIVGGGISGLVCAHTLQTAAARSGTKVTITLLERLSRCGGQINTHKHMVHGSPIIVESGAEGFVARSEIFPAIAVSSGLAENELISQARVADCELQLKQGKWCIESLLPGEAAQKLGFQVPEKDRGLGIRSFRKGMGQLVSHLKDSLSEVRPECRVDKVCLTDSRDSVLVQYENKGIMKEIEADNVVLSIPWNELKRVVSCSDAEVHYPTIDHLSHVSIHLLTPQVTGVSPRSFTIPTELQGKFAGLRAVCFMDDKFPGRCGANEWLFRFYFRPPEQSSMYSKDTWCSAAKDALSSILGIQTVIWEHFSPWKDTLPVFAPGHSDVRSKVQSQLREEFGDRLSLIGSEVWGAGLEVAAQSGQNAAYKILGVSVE